MFSSLVLALALSSITFVASAAAPGGRLIRQPPEQTFTGSRLTPDSKHPYRAPGPGDQRGPCPGMNTLANHGYVPRNGIVSFEDIVTGTGEGFNMGKNLSSALAAFTILARGNAYVNLLSIGGPSPLIPPLPGNLDGPVAKGMATHGRFEGDVSITRQDVNLGDNRNFQNDLFDQWLLHIGRFGDDDPVTGNHSVVNVRVMSEFKIKRFVDSQRDNRGLVYHIGRFMLSYFESGVTLELFANGTTTKLSYSTLGSFFRNQTFPPNWHRRASPAEPALITEVSGKVLALNPPFLVPGANGPNGTYIPDTNSTDPCALQRDIILNNTPAVYLNTTGILKQNVDFLVKHMNNVFGAGCDPILPAGPSDM